MHSDVSLYKIQQRDAYHTGFRIIFAEDALFPRKRLANVFSTTEIIICLALHFAKTHHDKDNANVGTSNMVPGGSRRQSNKSERDTDGAAHPSSFVSRQDVTLRTYCDIVSGHANVQQIPMF